MKWERVRVNDQTVCVGDLMTFGYMTEERMESIDDVVDVWDKWLKRDVRYMVSGGQRHELRPGESFHVWRPA